MQQQSPESNLGALLFTEATQKKEHLLLKTGKRLANTKELMANNYQQLIVIS